MVTRRRFLGILGAAGAVGAAGVAGFQFLPGESKPTGDPLIRYGKENCERCRMAISDARFAAAWREPSGREFHFDDIGCMVLLDGERKPASGTRYWVHDYATEAWVDAATASYALSDSIHTPMSYGVAASATAEGARLIVKESSARARVTEWSALAASLVKPG